MLNCRKHSRRIAFAAVSMPTLRIRATDMPGLGNPGALILFDLSCARGRAFSLHRGGLDAVAAGLLGEIQSTVCRGHYFIARGAMGGEIRNAAADGHRTGNTGKFIAFGLAAYFFRYPHCVFTSSFGNDDGKFVS